MSTDYPSDWNSRRKRVYERDDFTCQNCGHRGGQHGNTELHAHHVVPKSRGGTHDVSNLITLCDQCHKTVHSKNSQAPTPDQSQPVINYSDPDLLALSDAIIEDTSAIFPVVAEVITETSQKINRGVLEFDELTENNDQIRITVTRIFEHIDLVRSVPGTGYSEDLVNGVNGTVNTSERLMISLMDGLELVEDCAIDLLDQVTSCPSCGTSINESDSFCGGCGSDLSEMIPSCPECETEVDESDAFCRNCGAEIVEHEGDKLGTVQIDPDWHSEMIAQLEVMHTRLNDFVESRIRLEIIDRVLSDPQVEILWEYCPACGFPKSALRSPRGVECLACQSEWADRGGPNGHLSITTGDQWGKTLTVDEWAEIGEERNEEKQYKALIHGDPDY